MNSMASDFLHASISEKNNHMDSLIAYHNIANIANIVNIKMVHFRIIIIIILYPKYFC